MALGCGKCKCSLVSSHRIILHNCSIAIHFVNFSVHSPNLLKETSHFQDDSVSSSTSNEAAPAEESSSSEDKSAPPGAAADDVKEEPVKEEEVEEEEEVNCA